MDAKNTDLSALRIDRSAPAGGQQNGGKKLIFIVAGIVLLLAVLYIAGGALFSKALEVTLATAGKISPAQNNAVLTANGYVVAQRKAAVASKGTGRLVHLAVVEGDVVRKDQIIARLEDSDIKAQLEQARANLKLAEAELNDATRSYERSKKLLATGSATQAEVDAADARLKRVQAAIDVARALVLAAEVALENTLIRAPFDGTVLTKNADVGEIVAPFAAGSGSKAAVVTIADMASLQVEADVSESNIQRTQPGQDCEISVDAYPNLRFPGFVAKIVPTADRSKATVLVKIGFRKLDSRVLPEMSAKVLFLDKPADPDAASQAPMLVLPLTAVVKRGGKDVVFFIKDDKAIEVEVTLGKQSGAYVEVLSGVTDGDKVIDNVPAEVTAGTKVKIAQ